MGLQINTLFNYTLFPSNNKTEAAPSHQESLVTQFLTRNHLSTSPQNHKELRNWVTLLLPEDHPEKTPSPILSSQPKPSNESLPNMKLLTAATSSSPLPQEHLKIIRKIEEAFTQAAKNVEKATMLFNEMKWAFDVNRTENNFVILNDTSDLLVLAQKEHEEIDRALIGAKKTATLSQAQALALQAQTTVKNTAKLIRQVKPFLALLVFVAKAVEAAHLALEQQHLAESALAAIQTIPNALEGARQALQIAQEAVQEAVFQASEAQSYAAKTQQADPTPQRTHSREANSAVARAKAAAKRTMQIANKATKTAQKNTHRVVTRSRKEAKKSLWDRIVSFLMYLKNLFCCRRQHYAAH